VVETDANFNATWISASVSELLGWKPEEILQRPLAEFIMHDDLLAVRYERASLEAGIKSNNIKIRCLTESGSYRWMVGRARQMRDDKGIVTPYVLSLRDIHVEESIRRELESSEEHYRLLAENGADVIILEGADNIYRWASPSSIDLLGVSPNEIVGKGPTDFVHPDDMELIAYSLAHPTKDVFAVDKIRCRQSNGDYVWVSARARNVWGSDGQLTARVVALRDISAQVLAEATHSASESRLRVVLDNQSDVTAMLNLDGSIEWITPSVLGLIGWRAEEVIGHRITQFVDVEDIPGVRVVIANVIAGHPAEHETRLHTITGDERWVATRAAPLFDGNGETTGSIINVRDVNTEHLVRARLAESEERFRLAMVSAPIGMAVIGLDRHFLEVNLALCHMVGRDEKWMLQHRVPDILDPADDPLDVHMRAEALSGHVIRSGRERRFLRPDGTLVWVDHAISLLRDDAGLPQSFVSTFVDVTDARATQEKLRYQATHDTLTDLVNRRDLYNRAEHLQTHLARTGDRVGVLYIDIDGLKTINDTFGHFVGDATLKVVAERLAAVGRIDDVVSRVGGDEFVILLPALHRIDDASSVAQKILKSFAEPINAEGSTFDVGVSIGVALAELGETADDTLRRADAALYQAKLRGRGQSVVWDVDFN
jgi:diguanylate cyclase (GGDEF)-like protein/PAS domain S-box-containing protein